MLLEISNLAESSAEVATMTVTACSTDAPKCTSKGRTAPTINYKVLASVLVLLMGLLVKVMSPDSFETVKRTFQSGLPIYVYNWNSTGINNTVPSSISTEEQCDNFSMHFNEQRLNKALKDKLHGQRLARKVIMDFLLQHIGNQTTSPLILSMHGPGGVGKTYASRIIAHHLYRQGSESRFIHELDLVTPHGGTRWDQYHSILNWIKGNVSACPYSVFIMDKAFDLEFLKYFATLLKDPAVDYTKSIFLLTSFFLFRDITQKTHDLKNAKVPHTKFVSRDFEDVINKISSRGSMYGLPKFTIVPFLPLEHSHVILCIHDELRRRNCTGIMDVDVIGKVEHEMGIFEEFLNVPRVASFTISCELVSDAVDRAIQRYSWNCIKR